MKLILFVFFSLACAMPDGLDKQSGQVEQSPRGANEWICSTPTFQLLVGDGRCDDFVNVEHEGCEWDGGDCCGPDVNTDHCSQCECLDPNFGGPTTAPPPPVTTEGPSDACGSPQWFVIFDNLPCDIRIPGHLDIRLSGYLVIRPDNLMGRWPDILVA